MNWSLLAHTAGPVIVFALGVGFADKVRNFIKGIPGDVAAGADSVWDRVVADSKAAAAKVVADAKARLAPTQVAAPAAVAQAAPPAA